MSSAPRWMQWDWTEFLQNEHVRAMSTKAVGAYVLLQGAAWFASPACTVPDDDATLTRLAGLSPDDWSEVRHEVLAPWKPAKNGRLVHPQLLKVYRDGNKRIRDAKKAGSKGGRAKAKNATFQDNGESSDRLSDAVADAQLPDQPPIPEPKNREIQQPPMPQDVSDLRAYAQEVVGLPKEWLVRVQSNIPDFGVAVVAGGLEHLASRRATARIKGVENPPGFLRDLFAKVEAGEREPDQANPYMPFTEWRALKQAQLEQTLRDRRGDRRTA